MMNDEKIEKLINFVKLISNTYCECQGYGNSSDCCNTVGEFRFDAEELIKEIK